MANDNNTDEPNPNTDNKGKKTKPLSLKHARFVAEYLRDFNATRAYMRAYPSSGYDAARMSASRLLARDNVLQAIMDQKNMVLMQADEAMLLTSDIASADIGILLKEEAGDIVVDLKKAHELGMTKLIKKIRQNTRIDKDGSSTTTTEVELYDSQTAQRDILKIHGKFIDNVDIKSGGKTIEGIVTIYIPDNGRK